MSRRWQAFTPTTMSSRRHFLHGIGAMLALPALPVIDAIAERLGAKTEGERAAALELALEALYLAKKIDKNTDGAETVYG